MSLKCFFGEIVHNTVLTEIDLHISQTFISEIWFRLTQLYKAGVNPEAHSAYCHQGKIQSVLTSSNYYHNVCDILAHISTYVSHFNEFKALSDI